MNKVSNSLNAKLKQGGPAEEGPLEDAREEMAKFKDEISNAMKVLGDLKGKVAFSRSALHAKALAERNAHIEARNQ